MTSIVGPEVRTPLPAPTTFEMQLSEAVESAWGRGSGTVWGGVQRVLGFGLGVSPASVGAISVTDAGVINNRPLSAGLITKPRRFVLVAVGDTVGLTRQAQAIRNLIPLTMHLTTVGLAEKVDQVWRVRQIIAVEGSEFGDQVKQNFPLVRDVERVSRVSSDDEPSTREPRNLFGNDSGTDDNSDRVSEFEAWEHGLELPAPIQQLATQLVAEFDARSLVFDQPERLAKSCIFALLRGHLVLHGPPGTAKTTLASLLVELFDCDRSLHTATSDWTTYDVIGGYRPGSGADGKETLVSHYGCVTEAVLECQQSVEDHVANKTGKQANWLVIDELNRADIDRAIGPLYTVLGGGVSTVPLWFVADEFTKDLVVPTRFRIIGTMNDVDTAFVNELSQGLARRFTFVYVGVPSAGQMARESDALIEQARTWLVERVPSLLGSAPIDRADQLIGDDQYRNAVQRLDELVLWIRHGSRDSDTVEPDSFDYQLYDLDNDDDGAGQTDNAALAYGPRWPLGTAQVLEVHRQLILSAAAGTGLDEALDDAVSQSIVPQFANAPRGTVQLLAAKLEQPDWALSKAALDRILDPLSS